MQYSTLLLDLDGTVYPQNNGIWEEIAARMEQFMHEKLNLPPAEIPGLRQTYYQQYGTTLSGLRNNYQIDEEEYLKYVHDVPLHQYLNPDIKLRKLLIKLPLQKWIFTNSDQAHAERVLNTLNIKDLFEGILDITRFNYMNKPDQKVYQLALDAIGNPLPETCVFVDDSPINLSPAKQMGMTTILVGNKPKNEFIDHQIPNIYDLTSVLYL
ncbi:MAG: pyrimidine 5'-nucleotidase [Anaerolineales bacterium]|jgi:putative hydrolase of the HAD superfamily